MIIYFILPGSFYNNQWNLPAKEKRALKHIHEGMVINKSKACFAIIKSQLQAGMGVQPVWGPNKEN